MIFSLRQYRRLKSRIRIRYQSKWKRLKSHLKQVPSGELKDWIRHHQTELSTFSNLNWFFLKQLEMYLRLSQLHPEKSTGISLSREEEQVFDIWNSSEFADVFLASLNKGKTVSEASRITLRQFEQHLLTLGKRHVEKVSAFSKSYRVQVALGERIREGKISPLLGTTLHLDGKDLELMTHSLKEMNVFSHRIELASNMIRKLSPGSWERFSAFTDKIIPIKNKEFVSYSHQDFPCVSMINLYDRDFIDLLDDLLHENGHHHLNHYLNLEKLIDEPTELIYFSPWRRTLRPLRGIYHAYFTFFWAFRLFTDIAEKNFPDVGYKFSEAEKEKILWRAIEEFHMLDYSFKDLEWARKKKLIHDNGWKIISRQQREINKFRKKVSLWERKLKKHRKDFKSLKSELKEARKKFKMP